MWLKGVRVIDLTRMVSGPVATRILADFGAEVIKVQSQRVSSGTEVPSHPFYFYLNRNKKGITLNLDHPASKELFLRLIEKSDMVVENFSPRVMENWGLKYEVLKKRNPKIIMLSMSSMGKDGPWRNFVCLSHTFHALSGLTYLTSKGLHSPVMIGFSYADVIFGLYGAILALSALIARNKTGEGSYIDLSGYETTCSLLGRELLELTQKKRIKTWEKDFPSYIVFPVGKKKKFFVVTVGGPSELNKLSKIVGVQRKSECGKLKSALTAWARKKQVKAIEKTLKKEGLRVALVRTVEELLSDDTLRKGYFFEEREGRILINSPLRTLLRDSFRWDQAPNPGRDNPYVYCDLLGMSKEELERLVKEGIIY